MFTASSAVKRTKNGIKPNGIRNVNVLDITRSDTFTFDKFSLKKYLIFCRLSDKVSDVRRTSVQCVAN